MSEHRTEHHTEHYEALQILLAIRRRMSSRFAETIIGCKAALLAEADDGNSTGNNPFAGFSDIDEMAAGLGKLNAAISVLGGDCGQGYECSQGRAFDAPGRATGHDRTFDQFIELVAADRLGEASRNLAQVFRMPQDRMITAARFFARAVRSDPTITRRLSELRATLAKSSSAQCMSLLVSVFGFQAVESRTAIQAMEASRPDSVQPAESAFATTP